MLSVKKKGRETLTLKQARRQDSVTGGGGAKINFGGAREVYLGEFERGTGAWEIYSREDQTNKVKTKKKVFSSKIFTNSGYRLKILAIFHQFLSEDQKKKVFVPKVLWNPVWVHKNYENTGGKHQFGSLRPQFALQ